MANFRDLIEMLPITKDVPSTLRFLREHDILHDGMFCDACEVWMSQIKDTSRKADKVGWRCKRCRKKHSIRKDSFWDTLKSPLNISLWALYLFSNDVQLCVAEDLLCNSLCDSTVSDYYNMFRDLMSRYMVANPVSLGGVGRLVQIDESFWRCS